MTGLFQDLRYSFRTLIQRPSFTLAAVLTLALGIGGNTAIFTLVYEVLLKPLPYPESERVVEVWNRWDGESHHLAEPEFKTYLAETRSFAAMAAFGEGALNLTGTGEPERLSAVWASADILKVLGVEPFHGRYFTLEEDRPGADDVVVLSHGLWKRRFGSDPALVGGKVELNGVPHAVVGILPPGTRMPRDYATGELTDLWLPLGLDPADPGHWGMHYLSAVARLESEVDLTQAQADLDLVVERMKERVSSDDAASLPSFTAILAPVADQLAGPVRPALMMLLGAVALVLLIASANVANLLLMRAESRRREMALRFALGAGKLRLLRQGLTESLILAGLGGVAGLGVGVWALDAFILISPAGIPRLWAIRLDARMLVLSILISLLTGLVFGLVPAWRAARFGALATLRDGDPRTGWEPGRHRLRSLLVVAETMLAVVLAIGAGLLVKSLWKLHRVDPGYHTEHVLTMRLALPASAYEKASQIASFHRQLRERIEALPEVEAAGGVTHLPLASRRGDWNFYPEDRVIEPGQPKPRGDWQVVTPGYFQAMGVPILRGRDIRDSDDVQSPLVLLVNRALAERYWPGESPVGQRIRLGGNDNNPFVTIAGVVSDIRHQGLGEEAVPELYFPQAQAAKMMGRSESRTFFLAVRTAGPPERLARAVRAELAAIDADLPVAEVFAGMALLLGAVGIFGVMSYQVAERTREIGIRLAIGAAPRRVLGQVVGQGLRLTLTGILLGLGTALVASRALASLLYAVQPADPLIFAGVAAVLGLVALGASYIPARRAAYIDPVVTLRTE
jgi:predicted permease